MGEGGFKVICRDCEEDLSTVADEGGLCYRCLLKRYRAIWQSAPKPNSAEWANEKIRAAIEIAVKYGGHDGDHHKNWVIDQMVRILAGSEYDRVVADACNGEDGPNTYDWDVGVAP